MDVVYIFILAMAGVCVVRKRVLTGEPMRYNPELAVFFIYGDPAITWSEFPFIAFNCWVNILGHPIMALTLVSLTGWMVATRCWQEGMRGGGGI
jgi:hypothetical protein